MTVGPFRSLLVFFLLVGLLCHGESASGETVPTERAATVHAGFFHPAGVDLAGYTVEQSLKYGWYWFYTFGLPSLAATGFSFYNNFDCNGPVFTVGVGIGSVGYVALAYQLRVAVGHFIKLGGGYTTNVAYNGLYPVLSYEMRFR